MQKKKSIPAFLRNTYAMLERQDLSDVVAWGEGGNGFVIKNLDRFSTEILPQYFKHQKYTSFVRQLNMYGFHKQRYNEYGHDNTYQYFAHDHFRRGDAQSREEETRRLLAAIRRKPQKKKKLPMMQSFPEQGQAPVPQVADIQSFSSVRSVSMVVEEEAQREKKSSQEESGQVEKQENPQEWQQEESSQLIDQITERVMEQNELLRNLHATIRTILLEAKMRSIQRLATSDLAIASHQESTSICRLTALLESGAIQAERIGERQFGQ